MNRSCLTRQLPLAAAGWMFGGRQARGARCWRTGRGSGAPPHGVTAIKMSAEQHPQPAQLRRPRLLSELQDDPVQADGIVQGDDTFLLVAEDLV